MEARHESQRMWHKDKFANEIKSVEGKQKKRIQSMPDVSEEPIHGYSSNDSTTNRGPEKACLKPAHFPTTKASKHWGYKDHRRPPIPYWKVLFPVPGKEVPDNAHPMPRINKIQHSAAGLSFSEGT